MHHILLIINGLNVGADCFGPKRKKEVSDQYSEWGRNHLVGGLRESVYWALQQHCRGLIGFLPSRIHIVKDFL